MSVALTISVVVALVITVVFTATSIFGLREHHHDGEAWRTHAGAAVYGAVFGSLVGFVLVPLRTALMEGRLPADYAGVAVFAALMIVIALRRGWLVHLPLIGPMVRAYRRASLRRIIETAEKQLAKLAPASPAEETA